jgi:hypothetical protein
LAALALWGLAGCHPATAQGGSAACAPPPPWPQAGARPGQPDAELAACLSDRAYRARDVAVPLASKTAGVIAQCEVEVDRFEGAMIFGGATGSDEQVEATERRAEQLATAAVLAYQPCADRP